jgi:TetR/AcrR family transcriptional regulator, regulator of cefoperazone and chloramphenicol sensitivity
MTPAPTTNETCRRTNSKSDKAGRNWPAFLFRDSFKLNRCLGTGKTIQLIKTIVLNNRIIPKLMSNNDLDTKRDRIIDAAGELFAERGFEATTIRDICQAADANVAAVNYYFGDKQRLYIEAVVRAHRWRMEQVQLPDWTLRTRPETRLADFISTFIRRVRSGPGDTWHSRLIMREIGNPTAACAELVQSSIRPQFEMLLSILRELLPDETDAESLRLIAFSIVGQCLFYHFADPVIRNLLNEVEYAALDTDKLAKHITEFSLQTIKRRARAIQPGAKR